MSENKAIPAIRFEGFTDAWEQRKLGELVQIYSGEAPSRFTEGESPYVKVDDLNYTLRVVLQSQHNVQEHPTIPKVKQGSVIFPKRGAAILTNKVRILGVDSYMDTNMMALTPQNIDAEFLYVLLSREGLYRIADTSTIPQINNKHIEPYDVIVPTIDEQSSISAFFSSLDNLITLHQRNYDKLVTVKKSMLEKMFPKGDAKVPEIRFAGFTDAWEQRRLGEFDVKTGPFGSTLHAKDYVQSGTPIVTTEHFKSGQLPDDGSNIPQVGEKDLQRLKQYSLLEKDIVFSRVGSVDINAEVRENQAGWLFSGRVLRVRPDQTIDATYLHYELSTDRVRDSIIERSVGLTMASINTEILKDTIFFAPSSIEEQRHIGDYLHYLDTLITLHQRKLEKLKKIKAAMLEKMFV